MSVNCFFSKYAMKLSEIITVDQLVQPSSEELKTYTDSATSHYQDNIWYSKDVGNITVVAKNQNTVLGLIMGIAYHQPQFSELPRFVVPHNLYSWAKDNGATALALIKAIIKLSNIPVVSDIQLTPASKKFLRKQIAAGTLNARTLNLNTGDVTPYDVSIFDRDDDFRVLLLDQPFGTPIYERRIPIAQSTWNHAQLLRRMGKI